MLPHLPHSFLSEYPAQQTLLLPQLGQVYPCIRGLEFLIDLERLDKTTQSTTPTNTIANSTHSNIGNLQHTTYFSVQRRNIAKYTPTAKAMIFSKLK